jgi:two-component system chemotaxis response regulator CheB
LDIDTVGQTLIEKVKIASKIKVKKIKKSQYSTLPLRFFKKSSKSWLIVIGASTGGPKALPEILSRLPRNIPASILIVQHMPEGFTKSFAERLNWHTSIEVREAVNGDNIGDGTAFIAPGNKHMTIKNNQLILTSGPKVNNVRPSVDVLFQNVAKIYGSKCIAVLLTGMGNDGAEGMKDIKNFGGKTIAQNKETCVVYGMPKVAIEKKVVDKVVPLPQIAENILRLMEE